MAKQIGLFFGSFNPVHNGHLIIANWMAEYADLDQVWFVVSPLNPFKIRHNLLADYHRIELVNRAIGDYPKIRASNIESKLPKPSYTIDTLTYLKDLNPYDNFTLIMGSDQLPDFHRWKNSEQILEQYRILVYPRPEGPMTDDRRPTTDLTSGPPVFTGAESPPENAPLAGKGSAMGSNQQPATSNQQPATGNPQPATFLCHPSVTLVSAPMMEISSTFIRNAIREGKDVRFFLPMGVWEYIMEMHFYE
jgi:nicotinate (nicotinamide) nucleotide adenylyltransferase